MEVNKIVMLEPKPGMKVECVITEIINIDGITTYTLKEVNRKTMGNCHKGATVKRGRDKNGI